MKSILLATAAVLLAGSDLAADQTWTGKISDNWQKGCHRIKANYRENLK